MCADLALLSHLEADSSRTVPRGVMHPDLVVAETNWILTVKPVHRRGTIDVEAEHLTLFDRVLVEREIFQMERHRCRQRGLGSSNPGDVIYMRVRQQDVHHGEVVSPHGGDQLIDLVTRVND